MSAAKGHYRVASEASLDYFPLEGPPAAAIVLAIILIGATIGTICAADAWNFPEPLRVEILVIYLFLATLGVFAFSYAKDKGALLLLVPFWLTGGSLFIATFLYSGPYIWIILLLMTTLALIATYDSGYSLAKRILMAAYVTWLVGCVVVSIGSSPWFDFARPATEILGRSFLDLRLVLTLILFLIAFGQSLVSALQTEFRSPPDFPDLRVPRISKRSHWLLLALADPFIAVSNILLMTIGFLADVVWKLVYYLFIAMSRTASEFASLITAAITEDIGNMLRILFTFSSLVLLFGGSRLVAPLLLFYLSNNTSLPNLDIDEITALLVTAAFAVLGVVLVFLLRRIWDSETDEGAAARVFSGATVLMLSAALSGVIIYVSSHVGLVDVRGFESVGVYSVLLGGVFVVLVSVQTMRKYGFRV